MRFFVLGIFLSLTACLIEVGDRPGAALYEVDECYFTKDLRTGKSVKWDMDEFPIAFYVHESTPDAAYFNFVAAVDFWNIRWAEYIEEKGGEAGPLLEVKGNGEKFTTSGSPIEDKYNMLIFAPSSEIKKITGDSLSTSVNKIQAVTYSQRSRGYLSRGSLKSADILVNKTHFTYYYDEDYNKDILALKSSRFPQRRVAFTKPPSFLTSLKRRILKFFLYFFEFFKEEKQRGIASVKKSIPKDHVDFPSLMVHEIGHTLPLAHVDEDKYEGKGRASRLAASKQLSVEEVEEEKKKESSVMKVELPRGAIRRDIPEFDLDNIFCGYYKD